MTRFVGAEGWQRRILKDHAKFAGMRVEKAVSLG
jgi:hypothetical protein